MLPWLRPEGYPEPGRHESMPKTFTERCGSDVTSEPHLLEPRVQIFLKKRYLNLGFTLP